MGIPEEDLFAHVLRDEADMDGVSVLYRSREIDGRYLELSVSLESDIPEKEGYISPEEAIELTDIGSYIWLLHDAGRIAQLQICGSDYISTLEFDQETNALLQQWEEKKGLSRKVPAPYIEVFVKMYKNGVEEVLAEE